MARVNPETVVTNRVRARLERSGAFFIKLSDSFTRGVPDAVVSTTRTVMVEFKVDRLKGDPPIRSWKSLGMSGAQDHSIKAFTRRCPGSACVITDVVDGGKLRLWRPLYPDDEGSDEYVRMASGDEVYEWLA